MFVTQAGMKQFGDAQIDQKVWLIKMLNIQMTSVDI